MGSIAEAQCTPRRARRALAVAVHDIEPATFERCALIRDWLSDHGVDRVTLLVVPARDLHPMSDRRPEMATWLLECERRGDAIAQHGFKGGDAEFDGLAEADTRRAVDAGRRVLKLAGLEPRGFVSPAYSYTPALREILAERFEWWAGRLRLHGAARGRLGPPLRVLSPAIAGIGAHVAGRTLRVDVHPSDLAATRRMLALESLLRRSSGRIATTYDELASASGVGGAA
jgi:hypothetical protein